MGALRGGYEGCRSFVGSEAKWLRGTWFLQRRRRAGEGESPFIVVG